MVGPNVVSVLEVKLEIHGHGGVARRLGVNYAPWPKSGRQCERIRCSPIEDSRVLEVAEVKELILMFRVSRYCLEAGADYDRIEELPSFSSRNNHY